MPAVSGVVTFNELSSEVATEGLLTCLNASGWASAVLAGRPYPDRESLLATAYRFALVLTDAELQNALSRHPRIGDRPTAANREAAHSRSEQSGVDAADLDLAERLRAGNLAYENKFDQVFLIRAAGRSGPEILAELTARLDNDEETEQGVVRDQLAQIAQLRLATMLDELTRETSS